MAKVVSRMLAGGLLAVGAIVAVVLVGMRRKSPAVVDGVRRFNKAVSNPKQMETAGTPGAYASIIEHTGRRSGATYRTPIGTEPFDDGWVIALPYGTRADWVKNVLAAGSAVLTAEGETVEIERPEIVPTASVTDRMDPTEQRILRLFNVEECMIVHRAGPVEVPAP